jgi:hypothetical protein
MEKIPTSEEFFGADNGLYTQYSVKDKEGNFQSVCSYEKAIEFAKIQVEAALKAASESRCINMYGKTWFAQRIEVGIKLLDAVNITVDKNTIINSYPLENIK